MTYRPASAYGFPVVPDSPSDLTEPLRDTLRLLDAGASLATVHAIGRAMRETPAPLVETDADKAQRLMALIRDGLLVREGQVITAAIARERAGNIAQAIIGEFDL